MTQMSQPWDGLGVLGDDGAYSSAAWANMYQTLSGTRGEDANLGVFRGYGAELQVLPTSPASAQVTVGIGAAIVQGRWYQNTAAESLTISANASGFSRYDRIVLSADYVAQTVRIVKIEGTPAASPALPSLTQVAGTTWQIPLANILVINAFTTIAASAITDERIWINAPDTIQMPIVNQSGSILNTGNLVRRDTGTGGYPYSVTTTTTEGDARVLGIITGRAAASGGAGYVVTQGVVAVICDESVSIGDYLEASTTAGQAQKVNTARNVSVPFGVVLTANSGAGTACLAYVNFSASQLGLSLGNGFAAYDTGNQTVTAGVLTKITFTTEVYDSDGWYSSSRFTPLKAGKYFVYFRALTTPDSISQMEIQQNGANVARVAVNSAWQNVSTIVDMNGTTDYIEAFATSTGVTFIKTNRSSEFGAFLIHD